MKFIGSLTKDRKISDNVITDGVFSVTYGQIETFFRQFDLWFNDNNIKKYDCFILEAENTVPSALILLYLIEKSYSFLLIPERSQNNDEKEPLPCFCRYTLAALTVEHDEKTTTFNPDEILSLSVNPKWKSTCSFNSSSKLLLRTSGSTGTPKMVMHDHTHLYGNISSCVSRFALNSIDRVVIPVPIYHMYGLGAAFLPSVAVGASIALQKKANLLKFIQCESIFNPNVAFLTPSFCNTLLATRRSKRPYRFTVSAGDRFRADNFDTYQAAFGPLLQLYGSTELGAVAVGSLDLPSEIRRQTAGRPMPDVMCRLDEIQDADDGGKLWCKRDYGFDGYIDLQGNSIDLGQDYTDGWFHTKDIAKLTPEGHLEVLGRSDHCVNRDGLLVFFSDLEKTIETLTEVESVAVTAGGEGERGKQLIAYCVLNKKSKLSAENIRTYCFEKLARRSVPDKVIIIDSMPLLPNGKVNRLQLDCL